MPSGKASNRTYRSAVMQCKGPTAWAGGGLSPENLEKAIANGGLRRRWMQHAAVIAVIDADTHHGANSCGREIKLHGVL